ncbi:hypothetical protein [Streptomyces sp. NPDC006463]|uniref:hypothetical protein n=1 Tax=Streptomyces sp. NPDC006463 TaxID=3364746 RepID=UPI0036C08A77
MRDWKRCAPAVRAQLFRQLMYVLNHGERKRAAVRANPSVQEVRTHSGDWVRSLREPLTAQRAGPR